MQSIKSRKKSITFIVPGIFFLIALVYWFNCNSEHLVGTVEDIRAKVKTINDNPLINSAEIDNVKSLLQENKSLKADLGIPWSQFVEVIKTVPVKADELKIKYDKLDAKIFELEYVYEQHKWEQLAATLVIIFIFAAFVWVVLMTDILRDAVGKPQVLNNEIKFLNIQSEDQDKAKPPYSLARTQLAVWITIIASVYIYAILWDRYIIEQINSTALMLMGISVGTYTTGAIIDSIEIQREIPRHQDSKISESFFKDILSDANGISIHRFQNVVWTIVAIVIYFYRYANPSDTTKNSLPNLDSTLLALTGISNATYLVLKTRENVPGKVKMIDVRIILIPGDSLSAEEKEVIGKTPEKLFAAVVDIVPIDGGDKVHAACATDKKSFEARIESEKYNKVEVKWEGTLIDKGPQLSLKGIHNDIIKPKEDGKVEDILIKMEK